MKTTTELPWTGGPAFLTNGRVVAIRPGDRVTAGITPEDRDTGTVEEVSDNDGQHPEFNGIPRALVAWEGAQCKTWSPLSTLTPASEPQPPVHRSPWRNMGDRLEKEARELESAQRWVADMANHCVGEWRSTGCDDPTWVSRPGYALVPVEDFQALVEAVDAWKQASERYLAALRGGK